MVVEQINQFLRKVGHNLKPYLFFLSLLFSFLLYSNVIKVEASDTYISIDFNVDMDTITSDPSKIHIFPELSGFWRWQNLRQLVFISDSILSDTTIYILSLNSGLKDNKGIAIGNTDLILTVTKPISYTAYRIPFEWENIEEWDDEIDLKGGRGTYKIKSKIHSSYKQIIQVLFCWSHIYYGHLRQDYKNYNYPHFVFSERKNYKAAVDSNGFLYLIDRFYGMQYRWKFFPEKMCYRAMDVSDNGEILVALLSNDSDKTIIVYLISPEGEVIWQNRFFLKTSKDFDIRFINKLDRFLIYINEEIYCYKLIRAQM